MFAIKLNGEVIHEVDIDPRLVTRVHVFTAAGEASAPGLGFSEDSINITLDYQSPTALPVAEDNARLAADTEEARNAEPQTFNENTRREEALKAVDATFAEKAQNTDQDLSVERELARAAVLSPSAEDTKQDSEIADLETRVGSLEAPKTTETVSETTTMEPVTEPVV